MADGKSEGEKAIAGSNFTYEVVLDATTDAGDELSVADDGNGTITISANDSKNNGTLNGIHKLKVKDTVKNVVSELNFVVSNRTEDATAEVSSILPLPKLKLNVTSSYTDGGIMDERHVMTGMDFPPNPGTSIPLSWATTPAEEGHSYFVIMYDSTASALHWIVKDIPNDTLGINEGDSGTDEMVGTEIDGGYWGPSPPSGMKFMPDEHRYVTEVYLLNTPMIELGQGEPVQIGDETYWGYNYKYLRSKIDQYVVGYGKITGTYDSPYPPLLHFGYSPDENNEGNIIFNIFNELDDGDKWVYKISETQPDEPIEGDIVDWQPLPKDKSVSVSEGDYVQIAEVDATGKVVKYGMIIYGFF